mgnify:CR=1 FL=1
MKEDEFKALTLALDKIVSSEEPMNVPGDIGLFINKFNYSYRNLLNEARKHNVIPNKKGGIDGSVVCDEVNLYPLIDFSFENRNNDDSFYASFLEQVMICPELKSLIHLRVYDDGSSLDNYIRENIENMPFSEEFKVINLKGKFNWNPPLYLSRGKSEVSIINANQKNWNDFPFLMYFGDEINIDCHPFEFQPYKRNTVQDGSLFEFSALRVVHGKYEGSNNFLVPNIFSEGYVKFKISDIDNLNEGGFYSILAGKEPHIKEFKTILFTPIDEENLLKRMINFYFFRSIYFKDDDIRKLNDYKQQIIKNLELLGCKKFSNNNIEYLYKNEQSNNFIETIFKLKRVWL